MPDDDKVLYIPVPTGTEDYRLVRTSSGGGAAGSDAGCVIAIGRRRGYTRRVLLRPQTTGPVSAVAVNLLGVARSQRRPLLDEDVSERGYGLSVDIRMRLHPKVIEHSLPYALVAHGALVAEDDRFSCRV